jgi:hypothetical protein
VPAELPPLLLRGYPELRAVRFRRGGLFPRIGGWALGRASVEAITLRRTVFLAPHARLDPELLLHEARHVQQFFESWTFPLRYVWESVRRGYTRNRYEIDARQYAARRLAVQPRTSSRDA